MEFLLLGSDWSWRSFAVSSWNCWSGSDESSHHDCRQVGRCFLAFISFLKSSSPKSVNTPIYIVSFFSDVFHCVFMQDIGACHVQNGIQRGCWLETQRGTRIWRANRSRSRIFFSCSCLTLFFNRSWSWRQALLAPRFPPRGCFCYEPTSSHVCSIMSWKALNFFWKWSDDENTFDAAFRIWRPADRWNR